MLKQIGPLIPNILKTLNKRKERAMKKFEVYTIISNQNGNSKNYWLRIGAAFTNRDGSLNVVLNALPTNGKLNIREVNKAAGAPKTLIP